MQIFQILTTTDFYITADPTLKSSLWLNNTMYVLFVIYVCVTNAYFSRLYLLLLQIKEEKCQRTMLLAPVHSINCYRNKWVMSTLLLFLQQ